MTSRQDVHGTLGSSAAVAEDDEDDEVDGGGAGTAATMTAVDTGSDASASSSVGGRQLRGQMTSARVATGTSIIARGEARRGRATPHAGSSVDELAQDAAASVTMSASCTAPRATGRSMSTLAGMNATTGRCHK